MTFINVTNKRLDLKNKLIDLKEAAKTNINYPTQLNASVATASDLGKLVADKASINNLLKLKDFMEDVDALTPTHTQDRASHLIYYGPPKPLIITYDTEGNSVGANQVTLPLAGATTKVSIDWGDGTTDIATSYITHTYETPGIYTVTITGLIESFTQVPAAQNKVLKDIVQWGKDHTIKVLNYTTDEFNGIFKAAVVGSMKGISISATDSPTFYPGATMAFMFKGMPLFNSDISHWNVFNVVNMESVLEDTPSFDKDLSAWSVSNVTNSLNFDKGATAWELPKPKFESLDNDINNLATDLDTLHIELKDETTDLYTTSNVLMNTDPGMSVFTPPTYIPNESRPNSGVMLELSTIEYLKTLHTELKEIEHTLDYLLDLEYVTLNTPATTVNASVSTLATFNTLVSIYQNSNTINPVDDLLILDLITTIESLLSKLLILRNISYVTLAA